MFNHLEYDTDTLRNEYQRDLKKLKHIEMPRYYFKDNKPDILLENTWRSSAHVLFGNWLNYIYQTTPYNPENIGELQTPDPNRPRIRPGDHIG